MGGLLQSFFEQEVMKNKGYEHFYFCLKWLKFVVPFRVRKTIVDHKNFSSYEQTWLLEVNVGIGDSFPSQKANLYIVISLKIEQLFT